MDGSDRYWLLFDLLEPRLIQRFGRLRKSRAKTVRGRTEHSYPLIQEQYRRNLEAALAIKWTQWCVASAMPYPKFVFFINGITLLRFPARASPSGILESFLVVLFLVLARLGGIHRHTARAVRFQFFRGWYTSGRVYHGFRHWSFL